MTRSVPVLMYHYISRWKNPIAVSPELFEEHCATMARKGWRGIGLDEAEDFFIQGKPLPDKSVLITFDDGFLDNYVYAFPILEKYGHKGTIFAVTGKIETGETPRNTLKQVWNNECSADALPRVDQPYVPHALGFDERTDHFISWEEARLMEKSGVVRVSSHSAWHKTVFVSPEYDGFFQPGKRSRTFDRVDAEVIWGLPRFKNRPRLSNRAFIPSSRLMDAIRDLVPQEKEAAYAFFAEADNVERLKTLVEGFSKEELGTYEDDMAMQGALRQELAEAKATVEQKLGRPERSLCWPWGAFSPDALSIGKDLGYQCFFTTNMGANPGGCADHVHRFKAKDKPASWMMMRLQIYSRPWLANLYSSIRL
ncbi:polysaccharide deacetylase family protein [Desulfovibrio mangrovi]|uniref:polysaccharide deacetylase family protein n=1 Tax=Desulfovibrio mangrovi TaxID=2976983 RepID=UPI0022450F2C|nr:polysaccharide deacetylase family protein [Desulfovibrio mangrovi]UZP68082.1 polysaccharide deacetylase family protein [Desulfovibrio mangrovi]